jgi:TIR domain
LTPAPEAADLSPRGHVFISYVREDSVEVDRLQDRLEAAGILVWRDTDSLWPGEDWRAKIRDAITRDALVFIACFSASSAARKATYMNEEVRLAVEQLRQRQPSDPWLIPVRFNECEIPDFELDSNRTLASIQRADLFGERANRGHDQVVAMAQRILSQNGTNSGARPSGRRLGPRADIIAGVVAALVLVVVLLVTILRPSPPTSVSLPNGFTVSSDIMLDATNFCQWRPSTGPMPLASREPLAFYIDNRCIEPVSSVPSDPTYDITTSLRTGTSKEDPTIVNLKDGDKVAPLCWSLGQTLSITLATNPSILTSSNVWIKVQAENGKIGYLANVYAAGGSYSRQQIVALGVKECS